ncbi:hypothetical protein B0H16DRAFT_788055 [Mycena metata]|uniref:INO80 complex subunit B-like conserved region domain-containing protein n=1 Tax=Mycena metata TaxID=1033252 RepID=A0AAD7NAH5_9AGAR|nr:hypothetical protein B0H16DRAFT_788055 [Mycena metata]
MSNDEEALSKSRQDSMDIDEEPQSDEQQVEVDVLPDAPSESEASDGGEGENEVEEPEEYELEDEDDEIQESRSPSIAAPPKRSPLKIKFKMRGGAAVRGRRTTRATAVQVESEDSDSSESEEEMPQNVRLTKRQAALAKARKGIASSETSVDEDVDAVPSKRKRGAALDPSELALRKEESARKRRNVSEKKLQNEKAETINRLLKKQSRPRNKRTTALSTATPVEVPTPITAAPSERAGSAEVGDANVIAVLEPDKDGETPLALPTMYRWISTSRPVSLPDDAGVKSEGEGAGLGPVMSISFSVPASAIPVPSSATPESESEAKPQQTQMQSATCAVQGCGSTERRYRLVGGTWGTWACSFVHLKSLETGRSE